MNAKSLNSKSNEQQKKLLDLITVQTPVDCGADACHGSPYAHVKVVCVDSSTGETKDRVLPYEAFRPALQLGEQLLRFTVPGEAWVLEFQACEHFYKQPDEKPAKHTKTK